MLGLDLYLIEGIFFAERLLTGGLFKTRGAYLAVVVGWFPMMIWGYLNR